MGLLFPMINALYEKQHLDAFHTFNEQGGKFRLAVTDACNLGCFFCHNEGQSKPSGKSSADTLGFEELVEVANAFTELGGKQMNITGGEPLLWKEIYRFLSAIQKRNTTVFLNSNATYIDKFLLQKKCENVDGILTSLHTTDNTIFQEGLKGNEVRVVMDNVLRLKKHGYPIFINCSVGPYNVNDFHTVLDFCVCNGISLKVIALVRHNTREGFYQGDWTGPSEIKNILLAKRAEFVKETDSLGGRKSVFRLRNIEIEVKDVSQGKLRTEYCLDCSYEKMCGEGIYGLRFGRDGIWKPCLLKKEGYRKSKKGSYKQEILEEVERMIGSWENAYFSSGKPL
jgi:GTP 3',8-cyclase